MVQFLPPEPGALLPSHGYDTSSNENKPWFERVNKRNFIEINPVKMTAPPENNAAYLC